MTNTTAIERTNTRPNLFTLDHAGRVERIIHNARRMAKDALHTAVALEIVAPIAGREWYPICCGCVEAKFSDVPNELMHYVATSSRSDAGPCATCNYAGCDTIVVSIPAVRS